MVAWTGSYTRLVPSPGGLETVREVRRRPMRIRGVARDKNGAVDLVEEPAGLLRVPPAVVVTVGNVAGARENGRLERRGRQRREKAGRRRRAHRLRAAAGECGDEGHCPWKPHVREGMTHVTQLSSIMEFRRSGRAGSAGIHALVYSSTIPTAIKSPNPGSRCAQREPASLNQACRMTGSLA